MGILLNLGCGTDIREGWTNLDRFPGDGVDVVADLECRLPFPDDSVERFLAVDVVEHIQDVYGFFSELYRIAEADAVIEAALPYGSSDDAWEDPTHVRPFFIGSWRYFSQPHYYRLNYLQYQADWQLEALILDVETDPFEPDDDIFERVMRDRNVVARQYVALRAVKPARARDADLRVAPDLKIRRMAPGD